MTKRREKGSGSLTQLKTGVKKGYWVAKVTVNGKELKRQSKSRVTAKKWLEEVLADKTKGTLINPSRVGFYEWLVSYMETYAKTTLRETTYLNQLDMIKYIASDEQMVSIKLQKLRSFDLQEFFNRVTTKRGRHISSATKRNLLCVINKALKKAVKLELVRRNIAEDIELAPQKVTEKKVLSKEAVARLLALAQSHRLFHSLLLIVSTGLRRGELLGLKWSDIDFEGGYLSIRRAYKRCGTKDVIGETKTTASKRHIEIPEETLIVLKRAYDISDKSIDWVVPVSYLKTNVEVNPVAPRNFSRLFSEWCKKAGIVDVSVHNLRHTYATMMIEKGVPIKYVSEALGHTNIKTTLAIYTHTVKGNKIVANTMNEILMECRPA